MYQQIFKDVGWTQGVFQVSNYGRVYNTKTKRFLKGHKTEYGYYVLKLCYNGVQEEWRLNRLVATVWQRPLLQTEDAHHKNHFRFCNCCWNIQIKDSFQHMSEHKRGNQNFKGHKHTEETKQKNREAHQGKNHPMYGKKHSQQTKRKMSQARKQYWQSKKAK